MRGRNFIAISAPRFGRRFAGHLRPRSTPDEISAETSSSPDSGCTGRLSPESIFIRAIRCLFGNGDFIGNCAHAAKPRRRRTARNFPMTLTPQSRPSIGCNLRSHTRRPFVLRALSPLRSGRPLRATATASPCPPDTGWCSPPANSASAPTSKFRRIAKRRPTSALPISPRSSPRIGMTLANVVRLNA